MGAFKFGKNAKAYYSSSAKTTSSDATGLSWSEYSNIVDVNGNFAGEETDTTTRESAQDGWDASEVVLNSGEITFDLLEKTADDTVLNALISAWLAKSLITMMFLNQAKENSGARGLASNFSVRMNRAEPVKGVQRWNVTLKAAQYTEWAEF